MVCGSSSRCQLALQRLPLPSLARPTLSHSGPLLPGISLPALPSLWAALASRQPSQAAQPAAAECSAAEATPAAAAPPAPTSGSLAASCGLAALPALRCWVQQPPAGAGGASSGPLTERQPAGLAARPAGFPAERAAPAVGQAQLAWRGQPSPWLKQWGRRTGRGRQWGTPGPGPAPAGGAPDHRRHVSSTAGELGDGIPEGRGRTVAVGISGGVDSAVAAMLLKERG
jgi:hypothetical protein